MNMKVKRVLWILFAAALATAAIAGCKKDDETETIPYLHGSVRFKCPTHVRPGYTGSATASGATAPDGSKVSYYWTSTWNKYVYDTTTVYDIKMPTDTIGTFSLTCYAYAKGFNNISSTQYIVVVDDNLGKTITKSEISETDEHFTDPRDGKEYYTVTAGGREWMRQNLAWALFYNLICIPVAACGIVNPSIAAAAMTLSSNGILLHSLRLNKSEASDENRKL